MDIDALTADPLEQRIRALRKAMARGLGHRPSRLQSMALARAARLTALAEAAAANSADANAVVRLDGAASRARRDWQRMLDADVSRSETNGSDPYIAALVRGA